MWTSATEGVIVKVLLNKQHSYKQHIIEIYYQNIIVYKCTSAICWHHCHHQQMNFAFGVLRVDKGKQWFTSSFCLHGLAV